MRCVILTWMIGCGTPELSGVQADAKGAGGKEGNNRTALLVVLGDSLVGGYGTGGSPAQTWPANPFGTDPSVTVYGAWTDAAARFDPAVAPASTWVTVDDRQNLTGDGPSLYYSAARYVRPVYEGAGLEAPERVRVVNLSISAGAAVEPPKGQLSWNPYTTAPSSGPGRYGYRAFDYLAEGHLHPALEAMEAQDEEVELFGVIVSASGTYAKTSNPAEHIDDFATDMDDIREGLGEELGISDLGEARMALLQWHAPEPVPSPFVSEQSKEIVVAQKAWAASDDRNRLVRMNDPELLDADDIHYSADTTLYLGAAAAKTIGRDWDGPEPL